MKRTWLVVLAALLAGGAVGYAIGAARPGAAPEGRSAPPPPAPAPGPAAEPIPTPGGAPAPRPADWFAGFPIPAVPRGDGVVRGIVRTARGDPLPGVRLILGIFDPAPDLDSAPSLAEEVRAFAAHRARERAARVETISGPDGTFALTGLAGRKYWLSPEAEGFRFDVEGGGEVEPGDEVEIRAIRHAAVRVTVLMPDGSVAKSAEIIQQPEGGWGPSVIYSPEHWSPEDPFLSLTCIRWRLNAVSGEGEELASPEVLVVVSEDAPPGPVVLRLAPRPGVYGTVTAPEWLAKTHLLEVALIPVRPGPEPEATDFRLGDRQGLGDADLTFTFMDQRPGPYVLAVIAGEEVFVRTDVVIGAGPARIDLVVPEPPRSSYVLLRAEGPDGRPLGDVDISVSVEWEGGDAGGGGAAAPQGDGTLLVPIPWPEKLADLGTARCVLEVSHQGYGERRAELAFSEAPTAQVRFEEPASVVVEVAARAEAEEAGRLEVDVAVGEVEQQTRELPADGELRLGPFQPGPASIRLRFSPRGLDADFTLATQDLALHPGENRAALRVPPLHDLTVVLAPGMDPAQVRLSKEGEGFWFEGEPAGPDAIAFRSIPAGAYSLHLVDDDDVEPMDVPVPGPNPVRFEPAPPAEPRLRVSITDPEGPLARFGLRDGDLVIGVDGTLFENSRHKWALWTAAMEKKAATLLVLRGGGRLSVRITIEELERAEDWGGELR